MTIEPFQLVRSEVSFDTVDCLHQLSKDAEAGDLIGIAYGAIYKGRSYTVNACGEARRAVTFSRGMLLDLVDELRAIRDAGNRISGDDD